MILMKFRTGYAALLVCGALSLAVSTFCAQGPDTDNERDIAPNGKGIGTQYAPVEPGKHFGDGRVKQAPTSNNGIYYHGGPLILGQTNVYYIWYGNWSGNTANNILTTLAKNIGGSPYFNINTSYYNGSNQHVNNLVSYA